MDKRIIYKQDNGIIAIIIPASKALETMTIEEIALKDVPTGKPYKIINAPVFKFNGFRKLKKKQNYYWEYRKFQ